jgi:uncharacterized protein YegJ (DUF2314 family)
MRSAAKRDSRRTRVLVAPRSVVYAASIVACVALGCGRDARTTGRSDYDYFQPGDTDLERATSLAQQSVPELLQRLRQPPESETEIGVQVTLEQAGNLETVWLNRVHLDGANIRGRIDAEPRLLTIWRRGDTIRVPPTEIAGWYAIDGDTLYADYRWRVIRARADSTKRAVMDSALGLALPAIIDPTAPIVGERRWPPRSHSPPADS